MAQPADRASARIACRSLANDTYSWDRVGARLESLYCHAAAEASLGRSHPRHALL